MPILISSHELCQGPPKTSLHFRFYDRSSVRTCGMYVCMYVRTRASLFVIVSPHENPRHQFRPKVQVITIKPKYKSTQSLCCYHILEKKIIIKITCKKVAFLVNRTQFHGHSLNGAVVRTPQSLYYPWQKVRKNTKVGPPLVA